MTSFTGTSQITLAGLVLTVGSRYLWDEYEGTFTNVDVDALAASVREPPPDNCPVCEVAAKFDKGLQPEKIHLGVRWHGVEYHLDDCVLIKADEGTCHIGQIRRFIHGRERHGVKVVVRLFGRTDKIGSRPDTTLKDEVGLLAWRSISSFMSLHLETSILHERRDDHPRRRLDWGVLCGGQKRYARIGRVASNVPPPVLRQISFSFAQRRVLE